MVNGKGVRDVSKVTEFCPEKAHYLHVTVHLNILCLVCINIHYT